MVEQDGCKSAVTCHRICFASAFFVAFRPLIFCSRTTNVDVLYFIVHRIGSSASKINYSIFKMAEEVDASQYAEDGMGGPGAPTPLSALEVCILSNAFVRCLTMSMQGVAGLTKRDIQLIVEGGYNTVESVAYTPRRLIEQIKGISEQKATKILTEGEQAPLPINSNPH